MKWPVALYLMAGVAYAALFVEADRLRCRIDLVPAGYILIGVAWPMAFAVHAITRLSGETAFPSRCAA